MTKGTRGRRGIASRQCRPTPYPLPSYHKNCSKIFTKDWEDAICPVCIECPHNAVLLLCSSHEKGCRPYMCGTSFHYSNCFDQYKKAFTKVHDAEAIFPFSGWPIENCEAAELACPLCRGHVKGFTVVEPAREHLNAMKRICVQDNCTFIGIFKELKEHVKLEHPYAKPREIDPILEEKWTRLEHEQASEDLMSTLRGAFFSGDYVIERSHYNFEYIMSLSLRLQTFGREMSIRRHEIENNRTRDMRLNHESAFDYSAEDSNDGNENEDNNVNSLAVCLRREDGVFLGPPIEGNGRPI